MCCLMDNVMLLYGRCCSLINFLLSAFWSKLCCSFELRCSLFYSLFCWFFKCVFSLVHLLRCLGRALLIGCRSVAFKRGCSLVNFLLLKSNVVAHWSIFCCSVEHSCSLVSIFCNNLEFTRMIMVDLAHNFSILKCKKSDFPQSYECVCFLHIFKKCSTHISQPGVM
jgi:hypothetical protein